MSKGLVFSWAENSEGRLVHVDSVRQGKDCGCICPNCQEPLLARHGQVNEHGFAHHSEVRSANLKICYMVVLYKLAEQIIKDHKQICVPPYYGIFKKDIIKFKEVKIDSRFERVDKQPDVIATTEDGQQYLIEFVFNQKLQHKRPVDYHQLSCLTVDISGQNLETLKDFLLNTDNDREWVNNENYFCQIEEKYHKVGKNVRIVKEKECCGCKLLPYCCAVRKPQPSRAPLTIINNGMRYRLCKKDEYRLRIMEKEKEQFLSEQISHKRESYVEKITSEKKDENQFEKKSKPETALMAENEISCYNCSNNLSWNNRNGLACCGIPSSLRISKFNKPDYAKKCRGYISKQK